MLTALRRGFASNINEVDRMRIDEYNLMLKGSMLREIDEIDRAVNNAFISRKVNVKKMQGKKQVYAYNSITDVFDKKAEEEKVLKKQTKGKFARLRKIALNLEELEGEKNEL